LDAARFSFLLSVPLILAASGLKVVELIQAADGVDWFSLLLGMAVSGISAWAGIHYFLQLVDKLGMLPFVIYRLLLGAMLFLFFV
ncbi:undecaprenyl-diphosphate phosphatase, partial [Gilvimarinus sp. 1_MG-2023]